MLLARVAQPQLSQRAVAPTVHVPPGGERQAVLLAAGNFDHALALHRLDDGGHCLDLEVAVAQLAVATVAPRVHRPVRAQRDAVPRSARELAHVLVAQDVNRLRQLLVKVVAVPKPAVVATAPRVQLAQLRSRLLLARHECIGRFRLPRLFVASVGHAHRLRHQAHVRSHLGELRALVEYSLHTESLSLTGDGSCPAGKSQRFLGLQEFLQVCSRKNGGSAVCRRTCFTLLINSAPC